MAKSLIIYFSLSGSTKKAVQVIQRETGADIVELKPQDPYQGYSDAASRGNIERTQNIHPAIVKNLPDLKQYQNIFLGYPMWWSRPPMIFDTLFDNYDFNGKTIIPFTTSMSAPIEDSEKVMRQLVEKAGANYKQGILYDNDTEKISLWLKKIGINE